MQQTSAISTSGLSPTAQVTSPQISVAEMFIFIMKLI